MSGRHGRGCTLSGGRKRAAPPASGCRGQATPPSRRRPTGIHRHPRGAGGGPARGPRPAAPCADGRVALRLLPRHARRDGVRPRHDAADRHHRPGQRRRPHLQLRGLRLPGASAWCSTPTTSTRRCPHRGNGTSSGSPRASRRGPWQRLQPGGEPHGNHGRGACPTANGSAATPRCASSRCGTSASLTTDIRAAAEAHFARLPGHRCAAQAAGSAVHQGSQPRRAEGGQLPDDDRRWPARHRRPPPVIQHVETPGGPEALARSSRTTAPPWRRAAASSWSATGSPTSRQKVVGVGSVGTRCFVIVLEGRDEGDPLILQAKEATASVLEVAHRGQPAYATTASASSSASG